MSEADTQQELLPLGSIVTIEGTERKLMIVGRALGVKTDDGGEELYDYAAVVYPFGIIGDALLYMNHDAVRAVVFKGFEDEEDVEMRTSISEVLEALDIPKGNPDSVVQIEPQIETW